MEEHGYIERYIAIINQTTLGNDYYRVHFRLNTTRKQSMLRHLEEHPHVHWLTSTEGRYQLLAGFVAPSNRAFYRTVTATLQEHKESIRSYDVTISVVSPEFGRAYLAEERAEVTTHLTGRTEKRTLDDTDEKVLSAVSQDAKANVVDIAKAIDSTPTVVSYRLKQLRKKGIIQSYGVKLNRDKLDLRYYKTLFRIYDLTEEVRERLVQFGERHPHVMYIFFTIGAWSVEINTEVWEHDQYRHVLNDMREEFGDIIDEYETLLITREHKIDYYPFDR